jgi:hypothetical protein
MTSDLLNEAEAIAYLRLDRQGLTRPDEALRWLRRTGRLKFTRLGRYIQYRKQWLDEAIEGSAVRRQTLTRTAQ